MKSTSFGLEFMRTGKSIEGTKENTDFQNSEKEESKENRKRKRKSREKKEEHKMNSSTLKGKDMNKQKS